MRLKKVTMFLLTVLSCFLAKTILAVANPEVLEMQKQQYKQYLSHISSLCKAKDLKGLERHANEIHKRWSRKNKEQYAALMLNVCKPLSSGCFKDQRQYALARKYALLALAEPNEIPLEMELQLVGYVMTDMVTPRAPKGQEWVQQRKMDMEVRSHAWKRLIDAIDPNWDPNDLPLKNVAPPATTGLPSGIAPEAINDRKLRGEYEAAIEENRQKAERYSRQSRLRKWLKRFPRNAEQYIIRAYSRPPFKIGELKEHLEKYIGDKKTRARILDAVRENIRWEKQPSKKNL